MYRIRFGLFGWKSERETLKERPKPLKVFNIF